MAHAMNLSKTTSRVCTTKRSEVAVVAARQAVCHAPAVSVVVREATATASASRELLVSRSVVTRAAAQAPQSSATETKQWYALVANAEFFFNDVQNESIAEQLRERVRFFKEQNREIDFWLVPEPKWLDSKFPAEAKKVCRPCVALVSTDEMWITFMKLRLDRVLRINLGTVPKEDALAVGGKVPEFKKPEKWTAPYSPYSSGWWNVFLPSQE